MLITFCDFRWKNISKVKEYNVRREAINTFHKEQWQVHHEDMSEIVIITSLCSLEAKTFDNLKCEQICVYLAFIRKVVLRIERQ